MARAVTEKMLGANLPADFVEQFWQQAAPEGTSKNLIIKAMARLWLDTPAEIRRQYLYPDSHESPRLNRIIDKAVRDYLGEFAGNIDDPRVATALRKAANSRKTRKAARKKKSDGKSR